MPVTTWSRLYAALIGAAILLLVASGCGSAHKRAGAGRVVRITERDFKIDAPTRLAAGAVTLRVRNMGPDGHELIVVRAEDSRLPLRRDGLTVNEEQLQKAEPGALEPGTPGSVRFLHVKLMPGRYVLLCNMAGHYRGGMHAVLDVG
jgi:uncharacterized cupredoxin-like copper-binding protein